MNYTEAKLIDYLGHKCKGIENAISKDSLAYNLDITTRELRKAKARLVLKNYVPIGSTQNGYFYAKDDHEIMRFRNEYLARIKKQLKMIKAYEYMVSHKDQLQII